MKLKCTKCKGEKEDEEFHRDNSQPSRRNRGAWCKVCQSEVQRAKYDKSKARWAELFRNYGVTEDEYMEMHVAQDGKCAICSEEEAARYKGVLKMLSVDHCHNSTKVRALLCDSCNKGLGQFKDNKMLLLAAVAYLETHE